MRVVSVAPSLFALFVTLIFLPIEVSANNSSGQGGHFQSQGHSNARHGFGCGWWRSCGTWFIAPQNYASGQNIQGVDPATGILRQSQSDLAPVKSGLGLRRFYQSSSFGNSWQHQYDRRLNRGETLIYEGYEGLKSDLYRQARNACRHGWSEIRDTAYNGQYNMTEAHYHQGLCEIKDNGNIVARLPLHRTRQQHNNRLRTVSRPNGKVYTFVRQNHQWKTLSKAPVQLKRTRNHWIFTDMDSSQEKYTHHGRLLRITNAEGQMTSLKYDYFGRLKKVIDQFDNKLVFNYHHYGWHNQLKKVTSPSGTVQYSYDDWGRLNKARYQDGSTQTYKYQDEQCETCLTKTINAAGEVEQQINYDEQGRVISSEGANGSNLRNFIYGDGEVIVSDSSEAQTHYEFNLHHGVLKIAKLTDAMGQSETFGYDSNGYPANHTAKNGNITETEYNERGLLEVTVENVGTDAERETNTQWHTDFRKPTERSEINQTTAFDYDNSGRLTQQVQSPNGNSTANENEILEERIVTFAYNEIGQITEIVAPNGAATQNSFDKSGNLTASINALGHEAHTLAFDEAGRSLKTSDSNGIVTENQYNVAGLLLKQTVNGLSTQYQYDAAGRQTKVIHPDGSSVENSFDEAGRLIKTTNQQGEIKQQDFDVKGNKIKSIVMDANGTVISLQEMVYNALNQLIKTTNATGYSIHYEYDISGNQTKKTDANGNVTKRTYDAQNNLLNIINAIGGETNYEYDIRGNRTRIETPNGATTTFTYDNYNQLIGEISLDKGQMRYRYDLSGNRIQSIDAMEQIRITEYDVLNRKIKENWINYSELDIEYIYDICDNGIGKLCKVTDASGHTRLYYNNDGQVIQKDQLIDGTTLTQYFSYNDNKKVKSQTYPSGTVIKYSYDEDRLTTIIIDDQPFVKNVRYDAVDRIVGWQWADGSLYNKTYDANGQLITFDLGSGERTLSYDAVGNIIGWVDNQSDEYNEFSYDSLNRLTGFNKLLVIADTNDEIIQSQMFKYDANGNRLQLVEQGNTINYSIKNESNQLIKIDNIIQEYNANGNLINDGNNTYQYNARNRLNSINNGIISNTYNASNQRVKKSAADGNTLYAWTGKRIFGEYTDQGEVIQETIYFGNTPVALISTDTIYRIHADQINTPRAILNEDNLVIWQWQSKPFGENTPNENPDGDTFEFTYNLRFPGQYYDKETGLHYNFNRDYNPATGRYVQTDPMGINGGINLYLYASLLPLNTFDDQGLYPTRSYSSSHPYFHIYAFSNQICTKNESGCTLSNVWDGLKKFPAPTAFTLSSGWYGTSPVSPVFHGQKSTVPGIGDVVHHVHDSATVLFNITLDGHSFHDGYVKRTVIDAGDALYVSTFGEGENTSEFWREVNEITAEPGFNQVDDALRDSIIADDSWFSWF